MENEVIHMTAVNFPELETGKLYSTGECDKGYVHDFLYYSNI